MDTNTIREIYERQVELVYRTAFLYLKNVEESKDAVSSVFLKYMEKPVMFRDQDHERAWFITVTRNWCKDVLKSSWKKRVDYIPIPENTENCTKEDRILEDVLQLPQKYREMIYLHYYEGYSLREIAHIIGKPESTCQS
ncbi:MAG: sigma-70 family RNA polymerase sigma factor, partial [Lachnospiraceae bacterium]|nr:sigma-70 family RNA polymerase sigma factor [Lachnospiraceae bacterium]